MPNPPFDNINSRTLREYFSSLPNEIVSNVVSPNLSTGPVEGFLSVSNVNNYAATIEQGNKADTALQPGDAATPDQGAKADTAMQPAVYDPQGIAADVFARANQTGTQTASTISDFADNVPIYGAAVGIATFAVPSAITAFRTNGYYSAGDGGGALYNSVGAEPAHGGKLQSADGRWWAIDVLTNPLQIGAAGDGVTDDTARFSAIASVPTAGEIDLLGRTYVVSSVPTSKLYVNGFFKGDFATPSEGVQTISAPSIPAIISSSTDTGGVGAAFSGGVEGTPTVPGRTTPDLFALIASQGTRVRGPARAAAIAAIYGEVAGNLSVLLAARQSRSVVPQSFHLGTEECQADTGSRGGTAGSYGSFAEGVGSVVLAGRKSRASGWEAGVLAANNSIAGNGKHPRFSVGVNSAGELATITIVDGGSGLPSIVPAIEITDRRAGGTGGTVSLTITGGVVTAASILTPGSGYSQIPGAVDVHLFLNRSMAVVGSLSSNAKGNQSVVAGSGNSEAIGDQSFVAASNRATASGINSAVIASGPASGDSGTTNEQATGTNSVVIASSSGLASGLISAAIAVNNSQATAQESLVLGARRTINPDIRSIAGGDAASGAALSSNRKWSISSITGQFKSVTTFAASGTFADFGEYFENRDLDVIPYGTIVMLEGDKIIPWDGEGEILGVVSATVAFMGNDADFHYQGRYLRDQFGEQLLEQIPDPDWDDTGEQPLIWAPVENPAYDPDREYVARNARPEEWSPVGLVGQVFTRVGADVKAGDVIGGRLRVMRITTPFDAEEGYAVARCFIR